MSTRCSLNSPSNLNRLGSLSLATSPTQPDHNVQVPALLSGLLLMKVHTLEQLSAIHAYTPTHICPDSWWRSMHCEAPVSSVCAPSDMVAGTWQPDPRGEGDSMARLSTCATAWLLLNATHPVAVKMCVMLPQCVPRW